MSALVDDPVAVAAIADQIAAAPLVAFDLEFLTADRLIPTLCLLQVSWLDVPRLDVPTAAIVATPPEVRLVDALAVDIKPIILAMAAHPLVVAHAGRQDLTILGRFGTTLPGLIDTQVMAAFAGIGDQIGYGQLANEMLGLALEKGSQWTDWARRPLSEAQLAYADADVRHLPAIYAKLAARLGDRLAWARAESAEVAADALAAARITPETAWRSIGSIRGLDAAGLAAMKALAAWRYRVAFETDKPIGWVLNEKTLLDLARARPTDPDGVRSAKGVSHVARQRAGEIVEALAAATPEPAEPAVPFVSRAPSARAQRWSEALMMIAHVAAEQSGVAVRLLATRSDADELARAVDERGIDAAAAFPALATWRRAVLGELWIGWLEGRLVLVGDVGAASGVRVLPRE